MAINVEGRIQQIDGIHKNVYSIDNVRSLAPNTTLHCSPLSLQTSALRPRKEIRVRNKRNTSLSRFLDVDKKLTIY